MARIHESKVVKIHAPNKQYSGRTAGVTFVEGKGETDKPELVNWFRAKGHTIVEDKPVVPEVAPTVVIHGKSKK